MRSVITYLNEVRFELTKVIWPTREEVVKLTLIVLIISFVIATYVGGLDYAYVKLLEKLVSF